MNLNKFNYNVIIANMYEAYNFLIKIINEEFNKNVLLNNYSKILTVMTPVIPHLMFECLETINLNGFQRWPEVNKKMLESKNVNIVVQIDGKKKDVINVDKDLREDTVLKILMNNEKINKNLKKDKIKKVIYVKNRLINIVLK